LDKSLQQRLIGAILLVALGVIFIPVLLDGSGYKSRQERNIVMPAAPEFPPVKEFRPKKEVPAPKAAPAPVAAAKTEAPAPPAAREQPVKAFALQVSTVTVKGNAYALRDKLRKKAILPMLRRAPRMAKPAIVFVLAPSSI
jgi:DedD protein